MTFNITAPSIPEDVSALSIPTTNNFMDGFFLILKDAFTFFLPSISEGIQLCVEVIILVLAFGILTSFVSQNKTNTIMLAIVIMSMLKPFEQILDRAANTILNICEYGKLLLPVMTAGLAAQGGIEKSAVLYTVTAFLNIIFSSLIGKFLVPLSFVLLIFLVSSSVAQESFLERVYLFLKNSIVHFMKWSLLLFSGFLTITGSITGTVDATTLKATRIAISGMIPVLGGFLADTSEAVTVSIGIMKNAAGVYGMLAILGIMLQPLINTGVQYLMWLFTSEICGLFGNFVIQKIIHGFSEILGLLFGLIGTVSILFLLSTVCFMKGVAS